MSIALIWINIIAFSAAIMVYLANRPGAPNIPSSSFYLDGKGPKPAIFRDKGARGHL